MFTTYETAAAVSSTAIRLSSFVFLRWIPGHHFPPLVVAATVVYLTIVFGYSKSFGPHRPSLREAFPSLFRHERAASDNRARSENEKDHDEPALYHDEKAFFKVLLMGIPEWREWEFSYLTILTNVLLAILTLDMVFRGPGLHPETSLTFARVGYVSPDTAKILFREPDSKNLPVYFYYKANDDSTWTTADTIYYLASDTDYTYPVVLTGLTPETNYTYSTSNQLSGTFTTSSAPHSPRAGSLTFLTSSCIKANFPYNPFSHSLAIHGFKHLSKAVRSLSRIPSFMLFLGDFIYVDVPFRLSSSPSHYRSEYRRVYASPSWELPGLKLPWIHTLDDHEIANDWSGGNETEPFLAASDPFINYHVSVNPPVPPSVIGPEENATYFQFTNGPASFFLLDTRRYRTKPEPTTFWTSSASKPLYGSSSSSSKKPEHGHEHPHTILGGAQRKSLIKFLQSPEPADVHWKIIASSVPFTKNWRFGTSDTWGGFSHERAEILHAMHEAERKLGVRVVVLSGDRHEFAAVRFPPEKTSQAAKPVKSDGAAPPKPVVSYDARPQVGPHEFSVGPLSMFYLPVRTFRQVDNEDVTIAYLPDGNSKVGVVSIDNLGGASGGAGRTFGGGQAHEQKSLLRYSLFVDGEVKWEYTLTSPAPTYGEGQTGWGLWG